MTKVALLTKPPKPENKKPDDKKPSNTKPDNKKKVEE
jgi:hypothetical protein